LVAVLPGCKYRDIFSFLPFCVHPLDEMAGVLFKKKWKKIKKNEKLNDFKDLGAIWNFPWRAIAL